MRNYFLFLFLLIFASCQKEAENRIDTSSINLEFTINRFEVDFYQFNGTNLDVLKNKYPLLFPASTSDSIWMAKIKDPDERELYKETQNVFKDFSKIDQELSTLFKHIIYYTPTFNPPDVTTLITNLDYNYKVVYTNAQVFISLDLYLGGNHVFYSDYPGYIKENNRRERIIIDVANKIIETQVPPSNNRTLLAKMIHEGIKLYLLDLYIPAKTDALKIGYSKEKFDWALDNEEQVWKYFIENKLLYSTETKLNQRFLDDAPFSKFYLSEDRNSPGRIGQMIGWQIVRSFMYNNDVSLKDLLSLKEEEIFKKSKYKPRK